MRSSWADSVESSTAGTGDDSVESSTAGTASTAGAASTASPSADPRPARPSYVPPHLRNRPPSSVPSAPRQSAPPAPTPAPFRAPSSLNRDFNRLNVGGGGRSGGSGGGWNNRTGGWDRRPEREANPFASEDDTPAEVFDQGNTGINFEAYEDIPVETSGQDVPPPVNTFAEIDLGEALNANIRRCKYVSPTPVQRHTIPISLAGRDLMACAQTGSGKTAAFCFPIISGILTGPYVQRPRGSRVVYPLALILSPTRELSVQIHEEAKKFAYQTGVRVVVVYGGAPVNQQFTFPMHLTPPNQPGKSYVYTKIKGQFGLVG